MNRPYRMGYDSEIHHRRSIRWGDFDYSRPAEYFVTICTQGKEHRFGRVVDGEMKLNSAGEIVELFWHALPKRFVSVSLDAFVVMPNHIHGILVIRDVGAIHESPPPATAPRDARAIHELPLRMRRRAMTLSKVIGYFKMNTAKRVNELRGTPGCPLWQRNYYDRVIRDGGELGVIREYVVTNPLRWESDPENALAELGSS